MQTLANRFDVLACGHASCLTPFHSIPRTQLQMLAQETNRATLLNGEDANEDEAESEKKALETLVKP